MRDFVIRTGQEHDCVLTVVSHLDDRLTRRRSAVGHELSINPLGRELRQEPCAIGSDLAAMGHSRAGPRQSHRLIGSLTASEYLQRAAGQRFAGPDNMGHAKHSIDIERADVQHLRRGPFADGGMGCSNVQIIHPHHSLRSDTACTERGLIERNRPSNRHASNSHPKLLA